MIASRGETRGSKEARAFARVRISKHGPQAVGLGKCATRKQVCRRAQDRKVQVTTKETLVTRTRSPERRSVPGEKPKAAESTKPRSAADVRAKEPRAEPLVQGRTPFA